ncbi:hypothetical protein N9W34_05915 [Rickettsiales bacterium]|nr:hypothetical protein [Rickettsiales bacterium]
MYHIFIRAVLFLIILLPITNAKAEGIQIPRTVIAFYDGKTSDAIVSNIHTLVEMPLNHLGLKVEYYDIHQPLPDIKNRNDVRGVLTWLFFETNMKKPDKYLKWATDVVKAGKKYVILGTLGVMGGDKKPDLVSVNSFMGQLGLKMTHGWTETAFDVSYSYNTPTIFLLNDPFAWSRPSYETVILTDHEDKNTVHLYAHKGASSEEDSDLIITGPYGGYASSGYIIKTDVVDNKNTRQWIIDPFEFFRLAFETDDLPKPDTTTIAGRRIYYSHIDGDGFNNVTQLEEYRNKDVLSAEVIMEKAVTAYPDLPVTLTVIASDIDPNWTANDRSRQVAKNFFALEQVEAGSHTYSHPFKWGFFKDGNVNKEAPYLDLYAKNTLYKVWKPKNDIGFFSKLFSKQSKADAMEDGNKTPRAFAHLPFDMNLEVAGSIKEINTVLPKDKKVEVIMWSGDCTPWEEVIHASRVAGVQNINGGDTLFDRQHPSYGTVAPIGRQVGKERQIYASTSNEIPYTEEWTKDFDAYRHLKETLINTDSPIRIKPINIYYHLYSGEKAAGLNALLFNLDYASSQDIAPITTSHYTHIAEGFYQAELNKVSNDLWRVDNRGDLETIRFDRSSFKSVDFARSRGVIGQRYLHGSLYVYLDSATSQVLIALKNNKDYFEVPKESTSYLIESRWLISNLNKKNSEISFDTQGFGAGEMTWQVPQDGNYRIRVNGKDYAISASKNNLLKFKLEKNAIVPLKLNITKV